MDSLILMRNPINVLQTGVPSAVWKQYEDIVMDLLSKQDLPQSDINNNKFTFRKFADGTRKARTMKSFIYSIKKAVLEAFPIESEESFFYGSTEEMYEEAVATAKRMIATFEAQYKEEKKLIRI